MEPMSMYELLRIILGILQVLATLATPFTFMWIERRMRKDKYDD